MPSASQLRSVSPLDGYDLYPQTKGEESSRRATRTEVTLSTCRGTQGDVLAPLTAVRRS